MRTRFYLFIVLTVFTLSMLTSCTDDDLEIYQTDGEIQGIEDGEISDDDI
ncbi:hypothetical protein [Aquimarina algiphila]|nr:hypothetical protein [Aquimarina algiphila]